MKTLNTPSSKLSWIGLVLALALLITLLVGRTAQATVIDIMLVYDTTATNWVSTNGGMTAFSQDVINRMNQATQNSGVDLTFRLVHAMSVGYTTTSGPSSPLSNDLYALRAGTGVFAPVHAARDAYGADLVAMLVDHGSAYGYVGVGYMLTTWSGSPAYGFTVNAIRAAAISHVVTHEIGHNLGAHHSKYQSQSPGPNTYLQNPAAPYSAGWYFTGTNNGVSYHTIMAYNNDGQQFYEPAPLFSSPLKSYSGTTAGHAQDGDNARVIGQSKDIVAGYRPTTTANTYTLTVIKSGNGSGTVSGNGSYTAGATVNLTATPASGSTFSGWSPSPCAASFTMPASNLNCTATFNLVQSAQPDLIITAVTSPSTGAAGGLIDVSWTVKNQGGQASGQFWTPFYLSTDSVITPSDINMHWGCKLDSLAENSSYTFTCYGLMPIPADLAAGTYYLGAYADANSEITESNETNNGLAASNPIIITSSSSYAPDLVVTAVTSPSSGVAGGQIQVSETVKNQGGQAAVETGVGFYLSTDSTITANDIPTYYGCGIASIAPGESQSCGGLIEIPTSVPAGSYYLGAVADNANTVTESNETNNGLAASNPIIITDGSGYTLTLSKVGTGSGTVSGGGSYTAGVTVNLTVAPASGSTFSGWSPSPCAASFAMPASNLTCTATFNTVNPAIVSTLISSGDYNSDGRADLIWRHETTGQVYGVLLDGYSIAQQGMVYTESNTAWRIIYNGDFNGDGRDELLWWNHQTGQVYQMPMNGLNIAGGALIYQEPNTAWQIVAVGDLSGDSKDDLIWWNNSSGQVYGMVMNGSGIAQGGVIYQEANTAWRILAARDFNADGNADLLWRNTTTGQVYLMLMNGLSIAGGALVYHEPNLAWSITAVGDLNGDRKADLIWWNHQTGQVYGMLMNGPGIAQGAMLYQEPNTAWQIIANGDYTGDGKADLLWRNGTTGQVYEMVMNGLSIAGGAQIYQEANPNWRILAAAAEVPHLPLPGGDSDSVPLTGKPINAYRSFEGPLSNSSPPLSGVPLNPSVPPATE